MKGFVSKWKKHESIPQSPYDRTMEGCCDEGSSSSDDADADPPSPQHTTLEKRKVGADVPALSSWARANAFLLTQSQATTPTSNAPIRQAQNDIETLKVTIQQLQRQHNDSTASSSQVEESLSSLQGQMINLQRDVSSCATRKQLKQAEESIQRLKADTDRLISESKATFLTAVDDCVEEKLGRIRSWFKELEVFTKQRQAVLDGRMASVAKSSDLVVLQSTVERESTKTNERLDVIGQTTDTVAIVLSHIRFSMALAALARLRRSTTLRLLRRAWKSWTVWQKESNKARKRFILQRRITHKVLAQMMLRRKHIGFTRWVEYVESQKRIEHRKRVAIELMKQHLSRSTAEPVQLAFVHWRRIVLIDKIDATGSSIRPTPGTSDLDSSGLKSTNGPNYSLQSDLPLVLDRLKNDAHGSAQALAQEIRILRERDFGQLRSDWDAEKTIQSNWINEATKASLDHMGARQEAFEGRVQSTVEDVSQKIPSIESNVKALQSSHCTLTEKIASTKKLHAEQWNVLSERNDLLDERLRQLESRLVRADEHIRSLEEDKAKSTNAIDLLLRRMKTSEERHEATDSKIQRIVHRFAEETTELRRRVETAENDNRALSEELQGTRATLEKHRASTQIALDQIRSALDVHGICKPKLVKMIQLCVLYEKTAKEKNYVTSIDAVFDGNDAADLPGNIAAFAHDYALWIAYQADHEVLQRTVARAPSNHRDLVYADDEDLGPRRLVLLEGLKSDLCLALEAVHPDAGLLKLEARSRFINRLLEATDSALSKHDQIVIETSSRIGKMGSSSKSVPVCVACDRPLRSRRRANGDGGGAGDQEARRGRDLSSELAPRSVVDGAADFMVGSTTSSRVAAADIGTPKRSNQRPYPAYGEGKAYTMRCGFRMPVVEPAQAKEWQEVEGDLNEGEESENSEPNTGTGKLKAVLRQMSLP